MASNYEEITKCNEGQLGHDTASRKSQISMYSDPTHFVYELLQNADDYGATEIFFKLSKSELLIEHNGTPFNEENVRAITYFGTSTSKDDLDKTGRWGVGFKSIFTFTATPIVLSGDEHFEIYDLYRVREYPYADKFEKTRTRIILPFNHESKQPDYVESIMSKEAAYSKISTCLTGLNMNTLLFTRKIREIKWEIDDRAGHYFREDETDKKARWSTITDGDKLDKYLVFSEIPDWKGEKHKAVEIAFAIDAKDKIKPIDTIDSLLYVLFATTQETHLQFIINGPFRTNPSRETILEGNEFNKHLMEETCLLMKNVLLQIKKMDLLTTQCLSILPNDNDGLSNFFIPVREAVLEMFRTHPLVPIKGEPPSFSLPESLYRDSGNISNVLSNDDLAFLSDDNDKKWVIDTKHHSRSDKFLEALDIPVWGKKEFIDAVIDKIPCHPFKCLVDKTKKEQERFARRQKNQAWLKQKDDSWLIKFYLLLDQLVDKGKEDVASKLQELEIIRTESNDLSAVNDPLIGLNGYSGIFFPTPEGADTISREITTVKKSLFDECNEQNKKKLESFFERLGVKRIGEQQYVQAILENYSKDSQFPSEEISLQHLQRFIEYTRHHEGEDTVRLFSNFFILKDDSKTPEFHQAKDFYLDEPFEETGLKALYYTDEHHKKCALWAGYKDILGFEAFAIAIGVQKDLEIKKVKTKDNPKKEEWQVDYLKNQAKLVKKTAIDQDYTIDDLENMLKRKKINVAKLVWNTMCQSEPEVQEATYRPNKKYDKQKAPSQLIHHLRSNPWIPKRDNTFCYPKDILKGDLPEGFAYDDRNNWLTAIGFGDEARKATEEYQSKQKMAENLGITLEMVQTVQGEDSKILEDAIKHIKKNKNAGKDKGKGQKSDGTLGLSQPNISYSDALDNTFNRTGETKIQDQTPDEGKVKNPSGRREAVHDEDKNDVQDEPNPDERREETTRTILEEPDEQVREYLLQWYKGKCQICNETFSQRNGQPFFVANYIVPRKLARFVDKPANALCLCAGHFAKWQHGAVEAENIRGQINAFKTEAESEGKNTSSVLRMKLCGEDCEIKFNEKHLLDLQELLKASANNE